MDKQDRSLCQSCTHNIKKKTKTRQPPLFYFFTFLLDSPFFSTSLSMKNLIPPLFVIFGDLSLLNKREGFSLCLKITCGKYIKKLGLAVNISLNNLAL